MRSRAYRKGELEAEAFPLEDVSDYLAQPDSVGRPVQESAGMDM